VKEKIIMDAQQVLKDKEKYIGKEVEMFSHNWFAKIIDVDCFGWTFKITRRYTGKSNNQKNGDTIFYSHTDKLNFNLRQ